MATFGCGAEQLLPLRRTVEVAAATVAAPRCSSWAATCCSAATPLFSVCQAVQILEPRMKSTRPSLASYHIPSWKSFESCLYCWLAACRGHESSMRQWQRPGLKPGRCIPSGQLSRDQMVSLLRELDPSLEMREVQKFMVDSFSDSACVDCPSLS